MPSALIAVLIVLHLPLITTQERIENPRVYECRFESYKCSDFDSQEEAQNVFDLCVANGKGDVHNLDADNDGIACEVLPDVIRVLWR